MFIRSLTLWLLTGSLLFAQPLGTRQDTSSPMEVRQLELVQRLDEKLALDAAFRDQDGSATTLGAAFDGKLPVLLTFNYSTCPSLCSVQLNGLVSAMRSMKLTLGRDYRIVTVSLHHEETVEAAKAQQRKYLTDLARPEAVASGWRFLVGDRENIDRVAESAGFPFRWLPEEKEYAHRPIQVFCTPDGRISQYLEAMGHGLVARDLRLFLVQAGDGNIGSLADEFWLNCFHFDPTTGAWSFKALEMMSVGGAITLLVLGIWLLRWWSSDVRRDRQTLAAEQKAS